MQQLVLVDEDRVLLPPKKFGTVERGVYRAAMPQADNLPHLELLRLRSVIVLSAQKPHLNVLQHLAAHGIAVHHVGVELVPPNSPQPMTDNAVRRALELVLTPAQLPTLLCDFSGLHEVGIIVGILRRLQRWSLTAVFDEYRSFAYLRTRIVNEQYIELFDIHSLRLPDVTPDWFSSACAVHDAERRELATLRQEHQVDEHHLLKDDAAKPQFRVHFYSTNTPLTSQQGLNNARIQVFRNSA